MVTSHAASICQQAARTAAGTLQSGHPGDYLNRTLPTIAAFKERWGVATILPELIEKLPPAKESHRPWV